MLRATFDDRLQAFPMGLYYDFRMLEGLLVLEGPTDMVGCIELFKAVDPKVTVIRTVVMDDGKPVDDTIYRLTNGVWAAELRENNEY